ncbi:MAG: insulinase family protein [Candidatus Aminicenantes bacterium]|nr:insulinase family protein [Candidatus Aminicenantes bacterium]
MSSNSERFPACSFKAVFLLVMVPALLQISLSLFCQEKAATKRIELANGMRIFLYERHTIPLVNFAFAFNIGSKDETEETNGLVHILEHYILFRGTEFRSGDEIGRQIREHGAYVNAHTEYDLSTFEISVPSDFVDFALANHKEILFNLKITQEELDEEREVILEEINQVFDDPLRYGTSLVYQNLFRNHPYQRPIYGRKKVIETVTVEQMQQFYKTYFVPSNCSLAVVGDFEIQEMEAKLAKVFEDIQRTSLTLPEYDPAPSVNDKIEVEKEMDINMGYLIFGFRGPDYSDMDQFSMDVLTEILGRGINPMLNHPLLERRIYANTIMVNYIAHKFGGAVLIYIILEPKYLKTAKRLVSNYLKKTRDLNYSKKDYLGDDRFWATDYLNSAKNGIRFKLHRAHENGLSIANSIARHMHMSNDSTPVNFIREVEKIDSTDLREAARDYLTTNDYIVVSIVPKDKKK